MKESAFANAGLCALAHHTYLQAVWEKDWIAMLICWAVIIKLEGE
jgi:hypothetical protein